MRETSHNIARQDSQQPKHIRGDEQKVMKKSLSLLLAIAMVFSMFATLASAAELTTQQKFDLLKAEGIFDGYPPNGDAGLNREMTRAEFSKVLALITESPENPSASTYTDVPATHWAAPYIGAVTAAGLMEGVGINKFDPNGKVTVEQVAATLARALGLAEVTGSVTGTFSPWAEGYIGAALAAGLPIPGPNYKANALREVLVNNAYAIYTYVDIQVQNAVVIDDKNIEVTFTDGETVAYELETALVANTATTVTVKYLDVDYEVTVTLDALAISGATQTDAREITVNFNRALTDADKTGLTYDVKLGAIDYVVTAKWAEDNRSVALTANFLPAGEYDVTVKGFDAVKVTVATAVATKVEITTPAVQKAGNQDLGVKLLNQFNKEIPNTTLNISAYNATQGKTLTVVNGKLDLSETSSVLNNKETKVDDNVVITATYAQAGLSDSKTFKVVAGSAATVIKLGTVAPLKDKTRISVNESGLILPIELTDQYGAKIKLSEKTSTTLPANEASFMHDGLFFTLSDIGVISSYAVDKDGVFTFSTGSKASNLIINVVNPATGASANTTVRVDGIAVIKTLHLSAPNVEMIAADEEVKIPFVAADTYGAPIAAKDVVLGPTNSTDNTGKVIINSQGVAFASGYPKLNHNGELLFKFAGAGNAYVYAFVNGAQVASLQLEVKAASTPVKLTGVKDVPTQIVNGVTTAFNKDKVTYEDNYFRTKTLSSLAPNEIGVTGPFEIVASNGQVTGLKATGEGTGVVTITKNTFPAGGQVVTFNVTGIAADAVKDYAIKTVGTIYGKSDLTGESAHAKTIELVGKINNVEVAISQTIFNFVGSSDTTIIGTSGKKIFGLKAGTATITAYGTNNQVLATQTVTVSEAPPAVSKIEFAKSSYTLTGATTFTVNVDGDYKIKVTDQYGVEVPAAQVNLSSSNTAVATVSGLVVTPQVASGEFVLTARAVNGDTATAVVTITATP
jgi:hypothetical protein